ncbi:peptidoglycan/LPS O-acetylase OafA/YrhL [Bradyrhizobium sp. LB9.1b]
MKHRADIDGLRAIAILPVVLFHLGFDLLPGGFVGVDVFFVISGFLITGILNREMRLEKFSIVHFYERRIRRIFPVLFALLFVTFLAGLLFLAPNNLQDLGKSEISAALFASNIYFSQSIGYFEVAADLRSLLHTWSLAVEEQFYIFFPPFLLLLFRIGRLKVPILLVAITASFAIAVYLGKSPAGFYLLPSRAFELGIGALLALEALPAITSKTVSNVLGLLGLALISLAAALLTATASFPGPWALLPTIGAALVLYAGAEQENHAGKILSFNLLRWIGVISYSVYMWHWPVIVAARFWFAGPIPLTVKIMLVLVIFVLSTASWKYIEQPFRDPKLVGRRVLFGIAFSTIAATTALGASAWATKGLPSRFPFGPTPAGAESARIHKCFLEFHDPVESWNAQQCTIEVGKPGGKTVVLWGDSFAAHYVPGIEHLSERGASLRLVQATYAACPPLLGDVRGLDRRCIRFNDRVGEAITDLRPAFVLIAASWSHDEEVLVRSNDELTGSIERTVRFLRSAGVRDIGLIGDSPRYYLDVEQLNLRSGGFRPRGGFERNDLLEELAKRLAVHYWAPDRFLCSASGCRIRDDADRIIQWDDGHFTYSGSNFLADRMLAPYFLH